MAFYSMCVKNIEGFREGSFYITERNVIKSDSGKKLEVVELTEVDIWGKHKGEKPIIMAFYKYSRNFEHLGYGVYVEVVIGTSKYKLLNRLGNTVKPTLYFKKNDFTLPDYLEICREVALPLLKLQYMNEKLSEEIFTEFGEVLRVTFDTLNELYKTNDLSNYRESLESAKTLVNEIYEFGKPLMESELNAININKKRELDKITNNYNELALNLTKDLARLNKYEKYSK